jgi:hypothetical protein
LVFGLWQGGRSLWVLVFGLWQGGRSLWMLVFGLWQGGRSLWVLVFGEDLEENFKMLRKINQRLIAKD